MSNWFDNNQVYAQVTSQDGCPHLKSKDVNYLSVDPRAT